MLEAAQDELNNQKNAAILNEGDGLTDKKLKEILSRKIRTEKIAIKDVKLRTFITEDSSRDDLVAHVYDVTYGVIKAEDNLVIIDDSIVRGTTLKKKYSQNVGSSCSKKSSCSILGSSNSLSRLLWN
jgi:amidophosphoribosyltransferase